MRLHSFPLRHVPLGLALLAAPVLAAAPMDLSIIDRAVADFTGAPQGQPGGAKLPVDRRLRLDPCTGPLDLSWFGRDQRSVQVTCPQNGWKIYVAVDGAASTPARRSAQTGGFSGETIVNRGEGVTILARGSGARARARRWKRVPWANGSRSGPWATRKRCCAPRCCAPVRSAWNCRSGKKDCRAVKIGLAVPFY